LAHRLPDKETMMTKRNQDSIASLTIVKTLMRCQSSWYASSE